VRGAVIYEVNLFWVDQMPVENIAGSYVEEEMTEFLVQKTIDKIKKFPLSIQKDILNKLQQR
jgi:hypothetical protein